MYKIGSLVLKNNVFFAPMSGYCDIAFRQIIRLFNPGMIYTDMISASGLSRKHNKTLSLLKTVKNEHPIAVQLFGSKPDEFAKSIELLNDYPFDLIDINMGCPIPKVTKSGAGSALMKDLPLAKEIIRASIKISQKPVTIKIRSGWDEKNKNFLELGKIAEEEGISAICLHPRTRKDQFHGKSDWLLIKELKSNIKIPVIGSGDIKNELDAKNILDLTGCDFIMIGRAALKSPWLIKNIIEFLVNGIISKPFETKDIIKLALKHTKLLMKEKEEHIAVRDMRKYLHGYFKNIQNIRETRQKINYAESYSELEIILDEISHI